MGLILFLLILLFETYAILIFNIIQKSSPVEAFIFDYSIERILLIFSLIVIFIILFLLLIQAIQIFFKKEPLLKKLLSNQKFLWMLIYSCLILTLTLVYLFIQEISWFRDFYPFYLKLEPTLIWLFFISTQTFIFSIFWYSFNFTTIFKYQIKSGYCNNFFRNTFSISDADKNTQWKSLLSFVSLDYLLCFCFSRDGFFPIFMGYFDRFLNWNPISNKVYNSASYPISSPGLVE